MTHTDEHFAKQIGKRREKRIKLMLRSHVIRIRFALSDSNYFNAHSKRILVRMYILMRIVTRIKQSLRPNDVNF